jgi:hypothetical protein
MSPLEDAPVGATERDKERFFLWLETWTIDDGRTMVT